MGMTARMCVRLVAFSIALSVTCLTAVVAPAEEPKPWTLRDHYSFKGSEASLFFDVKTAEWKIEVNSLGSLTGNVQSEFDVDGQTVVVSTLVKVKDEREPFSSPLGDGTFYRSVFEPQNGLVVRYATTRLNEQAFMVMRMSVENVSSAPIEISAIRPAVLGGGYLADHGAVVNPAMERAGHRGGFALVQESDRLSVVRFDLNDSPASIGLGVLRSGDMESGLFLKQSGTKWVGRIECRFAPKLRLKPGETVEADPVWISFHGEDPALIRQMHGFAQTSLFPRPAPAEFPASWVAVDGEASAEDLFRIADSWAQAGMRHVLVNESIDGTLSTNAKALGKISKKLRTMGLITGVQIDPFADLMDDPQKWTFGAARAHATTRTKKLVEKDFAFFVLPASRISDEALRAMNLTRAQADAAALAFVTQAAEGRPVLPAPTVSLPPEPAQWRQAADTTSPYDLYGMPTGPVRFSVDQLKSIAPELQTAIQAFPGSIELVGQPRKKVARTLNEVIVAGTTPTRDWN